MKSCPIVLVFLGNDPPVHSLDWNDHFSDPQAAKTIQKLDETNRRRLELKAKFTHIMTNYEKSSNQICQAKSYNVHCRNSRSITSQVVVADQIFISTELKRRNDKRNMRHEI